jgi:diguanylate cyclase (GGDEF)-like protein
MKITVSFGVASIPGSANDRKALIAAADAALYRAKHGGKNRVEQAEPVGAAS